MQAAQSPQEALQPSTTRISTISFSTLESLQAALAAPPLQEWAAVAEADPTATLMQTPMWCLPWYQAYDGDFQPRVLAVLADGALVGVAPMTVETRSGRVAFAGDQMADYRDIVALPGFREYVVVEFLKWFQAGGFSNTLWFGPTLPESQTVDLIMEKAPAVRVPVVRRLHYGWRWWVSERDRVEDPLKKKAVRYALNYFRRRGEVSVKVLHTLEQWDACKEEFYSQHSLRQLYGGRRMSFDDPRKRRFFELLVRQPCTHVTALDVNGQMVAYHVGSVYRNVLLWGAPSFDIREKAYSPGLLLMVLTMQQAENWNLQGVDLTIGEGDLKERFSTSRVDLPTAEIYASPRRHWIAKVRVAVNLWVRNKVVDLAGDATWKRVQKAGKTMARWKERFHELGLAGTIAQVARRVIHAAGEYAVGHVLTISPGQIRPVAAVLSPQEKLAFHENHFYDLLQAPGADRDVSRIAQQVPDLLKSGRTLHTIVLNGKLAGWGISYWPKDPACLSETGGNSLEFPPNSVSLYDFFVLPQFRGRKLYQALLSHILQLRFAEGAERAYIGVLRSNVASLRAIERVGFQTSQITRYLRLFGWKRIRSQVIR